MMSKKVLDGYREILRQKGVVSVPDSEIEKFARATRMKIVLWSLAIAMILAATATILWRDLR